MNIKPYDKTIKDLLGSKHQFVIPRFQRDYSWDKKHYQEFLEDLIENFKIKDNEIIISPYFIGTMLFIGNFIESGNSQIKVIDGQQRITTITIFFSVLFDKFNEIDEPNLANKIFEYIMTTDDNGNEVRILNSDSHYPFFSYYVQDKDRTHNNEPPTTEGEEGIKEAFDFFTENLQENSLKKIMKRKFPNQLTQNIPYSEILKALRDQILSSIFISIATDNSDQANKIFEILNAKGKKLEYVDLIKNEIFEKLSKEEPSDFAKDKWTKIKKILFEQNETIETFFYHYWISKYKKVTKSKLYSDFKTTFKNKTKLDYENLLKDLETSCKNYKTILSPTKQDFNNRQEFFPIIQSLKSLTTDLNITQSRVVLLSLFELKEKRLLSLKQFEKTISYLENFHYVYNAIMSRPGNKIESIYSKFAITIRKLQTTNEINNALEQLELSLKKLLPNYTEFEQKFITLTYRKKNCKLNLYTKYTIRKLHSFFQHTKLFDEIGNIEHIIPESSDIPITLNIGNLILLENNLNNEAGNKSYKDKMSTYKNSNYKWLHEFTNKYKEFSEDQIQERAKELAKIYYYDLLKLK